MTSARQLLLDSIIADVGQAGLGDRSLRDVAAAVGSSHRMLNYHFGSRDGLIEALVEAVERSQIELLESLAEEHADPAALMFAFWERVSAPAMRPFVRLFFECVALTGGEGMTDPWLDAALSVAARSGIDTDIAEIRLGVAVTRGLLIDVLASGDAAPATAALQRYLELVAARAGT